MTQVLHAAIAMMQNDDRNGGKMRDFQLPATHLLPCNPVVKRKSNEIHYVKHAFMDNVTAVSSAI